MGEKSSVTEEHVRNLVDLRIAGRDGDWDRVRRVEERLLARVGEGVPKAVAARVLGLDKNTLNDWIVARRVKTVQGEKDQQLIATRPLLKLAAQGLESQPGASRRSS